MLVCASHGTVTHMQAALQTLQNGPHPAGGEEDLPAPAGKGALELTILMPCLNEARTIGICIHKAKEFLSRAAIAGEVVVADNGSIDGSIEIAQAMGARVVHVAGRGYGAALIGGIEAARGNYIVMGDADDSYDFESLDPFVEKLRAGDDLVVGNRFRGGIAPGAMPPMHYYIGNPVLSLIGRVFFRIPVRDFHCGLRGFRRDAIRELELQTSGMEFASEMVVRAGLEKLQISEVPTALRRDGRGRPPHLRTWRDGWRHLKFLLMYSPRWLYLVPGLLLSGTGLLIALLLSTGPLTIFGGITLDTNSYLGGCIMTVIGHQLLTFALIARYYAAVNGILPHDARTGRLMSVCKTDRMLLLALGLLVAGAAMFGTALVQWANTGFGDLTSKITTRLAMGGLSIIVIALQTAFSAFLFGIFDIPTRRSR